MTYKILGPWIPYSFIIHGLQYMVYIYRHWILFPYSIHPHKNLYCYIIIKRNVSVTSRSLECKDAAMHDTDPDQYPALACQIRYINVYNYEN